MQSRNQTPLSDRNSKPSLIRDYRSIAETLKLARQSRQLSQAELAHKVGFRQRQISDLERATIDPRLSTIQNVARALELELMLIPRQLIETVDAILNPKGQAGKRPLYALDGEDTDTGADALPPSEVGGDAVASPPPPNRRSRQGRRSS